MGCLWIQGLFIYLSSSVASNSMFMSDKIFLAPTRQSIWEVQVLCMSIFLMVANDIIL